MNKPNAYVFDIDGTLALLNGRNPYDEKNVINDLPNTPVVEIAYALTQRYSPTEQHGVYLIVVSGRHGTNQCRTDTFRWLEARNLEADELLMREPGDNRKDVVIKEEIYHQDIEPHYNVLAVFDDRDQCVELWRRLGLTCLQVAKGNF